MTRREEEVSPGSRVLMRYIQSEIWFARNEAMGFHLCSPIVNVELAKYGDLYLVFAFPCEPFFHLAPRFLWQSDTARSTY